MDANGNVFVADTLNGKVKELIAVSGIIPASPTILTLASGLLNPTGVAVDGNGNVFVAEQDNNAIKEIPAAGGAIKTLGSGFRYPYGVAVDASGNVFVSDNGHALVKEILAVGGVIPASPTINTLAANFSFSSTYGVAVDRSGDVFVVDNGNNQVDEIVAVAGSIPTSNPTVNSIGGGWSDPLGVAVDAGGDVFVSDEVNDTIEEILAAGGYANMVQVGGTFTDIDAVAVDQNGDIVLSEIDNHNPTYNRVLGLQPNSLRFGAESVGSTTAPLTLNFTFDTGGTIHAPIASTLGVTGLDFADAGSGTCTTNGTSHAYSAGDSCTVEMTFTPTATGVRHGALTLSNSSTTQIASVPVYGTGLGGQVAFTPGLVSTIAGNGSSVSSGIGGPAVNAGLVSTIGVRTDAKGNVYIADSGANQIFKVDAVSHLITSIAGTGTAGFAGDGGPATSAQLRYPNDMAIDGAGNIYISDEYNHRIRKVDAATGTIATIAGMGAVTRAPDTGDGGPATAATIYDPYTVVLDGAGDLYIADGNSRVRRVDAVTGIITTFAGSTYGYSGDGGPATAAQLYDPFYLALDRSGNLYIADGENSVVRKVDATSGTITTVAGNGQYGFSGDGGLATSAEFSEIYGLALDSANNIYIGDADNNRVRKVDASTGIVTTIAGSNATGFAGDGGPATSAQFNYIDGLAIDGAGNLYIDDYGNNRIRKVHITGTSLAFASTSVGATSSDSPQTVTVSNIGNAALTFPPPGAGLNPSISAGFTRGSSSTCPQISSVSSAASLAAGASCTDLISFTPTGAGAISGSAVLTDNALNATGPAYAAQTISLSGTAIATAPTVSSISPMSGPTTGGTSVTITGTNLGSATAVDFGSNATTIVSNTGTQIVATSPTGSTGAVNVTVTTAGGTSATSSADLFTYLTASAAPTVTGVLPATGPVSGGTSVTITGANLGSATAVDFGSNAATIVSNTGTQIVATSPMGSAGSVDVTVTTAGGTSATGSLDLFNYYPILPTGTVSGTLTATLEITTAGQPASIAVLAQGATGLDFQFVSGGTCSNSVSYTVGETCTVEYTFTPKYPGHRLGAILLATSTGVMVATGYIEGAGIGPQVTFSPGAKTSVNGNFLTPYSVAMDGSGNIFVADTYNNAIDELLRAGGYTTINPLGGGFGFNHPQGIAIDAAGNLFVADSNSNAVEEILAASGYMTVNAIGGAFNFNTPFGVAVDASGNVFVTENAGNAVVEILVAGGYTTVHPVQTGFNAPEGIAVDANDNLFVADTLNAAVKEIVEAGGYTTVIPLGSGYTGPEGVSLDGNSNLFIVGHHTLTELTAAGGYATPTTLNGSFTTATGVAVDPHGNIFVADQDDGAVYKLDFADAPLLSFSSTAVGSTSGDSPRTVTVTNNGNAALTFEVPGTGMNPSVSTGFTLANSSTCPQLSSSATAATLAAGASCTNLISFTPTTPGLIAGSLVITDNSLNATGPGYTAQTVSLSGSATVSLLASTAVASTVLTQNHAATTFAPVTATGGTGTLTYSVSPALPAGLVFSSSTGAISGTPTAAAAAATYTVTVTDANSATATATFSLAVDGAVIATTAVAATALTQNHAATTFTPVTATGGTGTLTYSVSPALPAGLVFSSSTGAISGTPTAAAAAATYTVTVTDANSATATATFSLAVDGAVIATTAVAATALTQNHAATAFTPVTATGGTGTLTYSVSPALPAGLVFSSSTGTISGTPTAAAAAATYTVTVTDANSATAAATFSLAVDGAVLATAVVASTVLTQNHAATAFTAVTATGGTGTLTYSVSPALPAGLVFSSSTGTISGTPTAAAAAATYTVTVTDANSATATATFSLAVDGAVIATTAVAATALTQNHAATTFTPVTATGGTGTLTYSVSPALPAGLVFSSSTGAISGTPTAAAAAATYTVTVTDANSATATATFSLAVDGAVIATTAVAATALTQNHAATTFTPVTATGGTGTLTYSVSPALPAGLVFSSSTGAISGTPTAAAAAATYTVTVTDANSATAAATFSLAVNPAVAQTAISISASPTTQLSNNPIVLTAQVTSATAGSFTGTVNFLDATTVVATVPVGANGLATYSDSTLVDGGHTLTAFYSGDTNFLPSSSTGAPIEITVGDLNLNLGNGQNKSVLPGAAVSYTFPLSPLVTPTFIYDVHLTATGLPPGATYTFSPAIIPAGSSTLPVTLNVQTAIGTASLALPGAPGEQNSSRGITALALGLLLPLLGAKRIRRRLKELPRPLDMLLFGILSIGAAAGLSGCGSSGFFGPTSTSGKYTITVTATSADLVRSTTVELTIQ